MGVRKERRRRKERRSRSSFVVDSLFVSYPYETLICERNLMNEQTIIFEYSLPISFHFIS